MDPEANGTAQGVNLDPRDSESDKSALLRVHFAAASPPFYDGPLFALRRISGRLGPPRNQVNHYW